MDNKEIMRKCGFREDFDWDNRFDLKTVIGEYQISTVDLGLNHQFVEGLPPLYYETMIFRKGDTFEERHNKENPFEYYQERYTTEEEARKGHKRAIEYVKENVRNEAE